MGIFYANLARLSIYIKTTQTLEKVTPRLCQDKLRNCKIKIHHRNVSILSFFNWILVHCTLKKHNPSNIYLFKVKNRNTRKNLKYVQSQQSKHQTDTKDVVLVFLSGVSILDFEQINVSWEIVKKQKAKPTLNNSKAYRMSPQNCHCVNMNITLHSF